MPPRRGQIRSLQFCVPALLLPLLTVLECVSVELRESVTFTEPILRSIPIVTGTLDARVQSETGRDRVVEEEDGDKVGQEKTNRRLEGRALYTNDGHGNMNNNGHISPHSWQDLDGGVFPQRNEEYPE